LPHSSNRNNRRSRVQRTPSAPARLRVLKPSVPSVPSANNSSRVSTTSKSRSPQRRTRTRRGPNAPTWLTLILTFFFGIVLVGAVYFAIVTKEIQVIVLAVLVIFATYLSVIKHFYPSESGSSSSIFTFILEVLKIFKGIPPTH